jgi:hypothetical protein
VSQIHHGLACMLHQMHERASSRYLVHELGVLAALILATLYKGQCMDVARRAREDNDRLGSGTRNGKRSWAGIASQLLLATMRMVPLDLLPRNNAAMATTPTATWCKVLMAWASSANRVTTP